MAREGPWEGHCLIVAMGSGWQCRRTNVLTRRDGSDGSDECWCEGDWVWLESGGGGNIGTTTPLAQLGTILMKKNRYRMTCGLESQGGGGVYDEGDGGRMMMRVMSGKDVALVTACGQVAVLLCLPTAEHTHCPRQQSRWATARRRSLVLAACTRRPLTDRRLLFHRIARQQPQHPRRVAGAARGVQEGPPALSIRNHQESGWRRDLPAQRPATAGAGQAASSCAASRARWGPLERRPCRAASCPAGRSSWARARLGRTGRTGPSRRRRRRRRRGSSRARWPRRGGASSGRLCRRSSTRSASSGKRRGTRPQRGKRSRCTTFCRQTKVRGTARSPCCDACARAC